MKLLQLPFVRSRRKESTAPPVAAETDDRAEGLAAPGTPPSAVSGATDSPLPSPRFAIGDLVLVGPNRVEGCVRKPPEYDHARKVYYYSVRVDGQTSNLAEADLQRHDPDDDPTEWITSAPSGHRAMSAALTKAKLTANLTDTFYSFGACKTEFRPYQFRPVIKLLRTDRHRLLIADEVGLGKTIEAGLIWTELEARGLADRVLVICPSMLEHKWVAEMRDHFGFELSTLDHLKMDKWLEHSQAGMFFTREKVVCSIERLRLWDGLEDYSERMPHFDLVIVDEAHWLRNKGTKSHGLGQRLSDWAGVGGALLFLSATPLNLGNKDLFNLLNLLDETEFDDVDALEKRLAPNAALNAVSESLLRPDMQANDRTAALDTMKETEFGRITSRDTLYKTLRGILGKPVLAPADVAEARRLICDLNALAAVLTRTRKTEVNEQQAMRDPRLVLVNLDKPEMDLYQAVCRWQKERAKHVQLPFGFAGQMQTRLAGSCLQAMKQHVLNTDKQAETAEDEEEDGDGGTYTNGYAPTGFWADQDQKHPPDYVIKAAKALGTQDTKYDAFSQAISDIRGEGRKVLVFTFSRRTLSYLVGRLERDGWNVCEMHGGVRKSDRAPMIAAFRAGNYDIMVATRVASEGLDFEFCGAVANYDLPWNPMAVEQRIGRIDRIGQSEQKIYVLNCFANHTIEGEIMRRVYERIGVFNQSIGELEPILWNKDLGKSMAEIAEMSTDFDFRLTVEQKHLLDRRVQAAKAANEHMAQELEDSADFLNVVDVDKFADDVRDSGRLVGQEELVSLLTEWAEGTDEGAWCRTSPDGLWVLFRGDSVTARDLDLVVEAKERSEREVDDCRSQLLNEMDIRLCLDPEKARRGGHDLLNVNHPLIRAALRSPNISACRFGSARVDANAHIQPGRYLVLAAIAKWEGIRSSRQMWTTAVNEDCAPCGQEVGDALMSAVSGAELSAPDSTWTWSSEAVRALEEQVRARHNQAKTDYDTQNLRLADARRASYRVSHDKAVRSIDQAIDTLRTSGKTDMIRLQENRKRLAEHRLEEQMEKLDNESRGTVSFDYLALCDLEVVGPTVDPGGGPSQAEEQAMG